jgi:hypothetical protein
VLEGISIQSGAGVCNATTGASQFDFALCPTKCAFASDFSSGQSLSCPNGINVVGEFEKFSLKGNCDANAVSAGTSAAPITAITTEQSSSGDTATAPKAEKSRTGVLVGGGVLLSTYVILLHVVQHDTTSVVLISAYLSSSN